MQLKGLVEKLEADLETRNSDVQRLEAKLDAALSSNAIAEQQRMAVADMEAWKTNLEERERKVSELEKRIEEWEQVRTAVGVERKRLGDIAEDQERTQKFLEGRLAASPSPSPRPDSLQLPGATAESSHPPALRIATTTTTSPPTGADIPLPGSPAESVSSSASPEELREHLLSLRETHSKTLEDLSGVTHKYRDALKEISDLAAQISEIKLQQATTPLASQGDLSAGDAGSDGESAITPIRPGGRTPSTASPGPNRRRRTLGRGEPPIPLNGTTGPARKLFFRHASSVESLHTRYVFLAFFRVTPSSNTSSFI